EGGRDGLQEGSGTDGGWRSGTGLAAGLADGVELIGFGVTEGGDGAIGPGDDHGIGMVDMAQADDLFVVDGGLEAAAGDDFAIEDLRAAEDPDLAADGKGVGGEAMEQDGQIMVVVELAGVVAIQEGGPVLVVDDQVEIAVIIQVAIGGAIGKARMGEAPVGADVLEMQVAQVPEYLVEQGFGGHLVEQAVQSCLIAGGGHLLKGLARRELQKILVRQIAGNAVGNEDIVEAIIVGIEEERPPGPVGGRDAGEIGDLGELPVAVVELEGVLKELVIETRALFEAIYIDVLEG